MPTGAFIFGCAGARLQPEEARLFADADPWGFILFARNVETPDQLRRLTGDLRDAVGRNAPVLVDQEGGRVQRLRPPYWRDWMPPLEQAALGGAASMRLRGRIIAAELRDVGIDVNCTPCADVAVPETHPFLRNRCYADNAECVIEMARALAGGQRDGGVLPVLKHMPGHGRAVSDSHHDLPRVDAPAETLRAVDFAPFRALADLPMAMTSHVVYTAFDHRPATVSPVMVALMRDEIGFGGLLMTDDISMQALSGTVAGRGAAALAAGCDVVLHCNGDRTEMEELVAVAGAMSDTAAARAEVALGCRSDPDAVDIAALEADLRALLEGAAHAG